MWHVVAVKHLKPSILQGALEPSPGVSVQGSVKSALKDAGYEVLDGGDGAKREFMWLQQRWASGPACIVLVAGGHDAVRVCSCLVLCRGGPPPEGGRVCCAHCSPADAASAAGSQCCAAGLQQLVCGCSVHAVGVVHALRDSGGAGVTKQPRICGMQWALRGVCVPCMCV